MSNIVKYIRNRTPPIDDLPLYLSLDTNNNETQPEISFSNKDEPNQEIISITLKYIY